MRAAGAPASAPDRGGELSRGLSLWNTSLLVIGLTIGGGIFLTPTSIAKAVPNETRILLLWAAGGALAILGGLVNAELGAMLPQPGGMYVFFREAFGELPAFLYAWVGYWIILIGADAAVAIGFAQYFSVFFPSLGSSNVLATLGPFPVSAAQVVAVALTLVLSLTHYIGVKEGARVQGILTSIIVVALLWIAVGGALAPEPSEAAAAASPLAALTMAGVGTALVAIFWTYYGWNEIVAVAGEVANPRRNLPLALILGTGLITLVYVAVNAVFLKAIPVVEMAGIEQPGSLASQRLFGPWAGMLVAFGVVAAAAGCTSAGLAPGPRIVYALAKDGLFPASFARVHPRYQTPSFGIVVQAIWMSLLCLSGRYEQLYTYSTFFVILAYAATGIALFVLRRNRPDLPRPYRCWGYPVVPLLFVGSTLLVAANTLRQQPTETLAGIGILLLGLPVYFAMRRRSGKSAP